RPLNRVLQRAIGVVHLRTLLQAPFLLLRRRAREQVRMQLPAELVEVTLQLRRIEIQLPRQAEERKIICRRRWLQLPARFAEQRRAHVAARPARAVRLVLRFELDRVQLVLVCNGHVSPYTIQPGSYAGPERNAEVFVIPRRSRGIPPASTGAMP